MDPCAAVEKELDKVITKFTLIRNQSDTIINDVTMHFQELRKEIDDVPPDCKLAPEQIVAFQDALTKAKGKLQRLTTDHRDLHGTVSKVGKAIDRNFSTDLSSTIRNDVLAYEQNLQLLNKIIAQHFYRQGMDDVANLLIKESSLQVEDIQPEPYAELHQIWELINDRKLDAAIAWATEHAVALEIRKSSLEFKLHRLAFLQLLCNGMDAQNIAVEYARVHLSKFVRTHSKEIQSLMGVFIFLPTGIQNSPYKHLFAPEMWIETADTFLKDACSTLGINKDSPLSVVANAGCTALPALLNLKQVMQSRQVIGIWNGRDELPIEIELDPDHRYHSIFACPILKQQSSEENPPMKLTCGHVISHDALNKLSTGPVLKCPYCPMEQSPNDAKLIYF